MIQIKYSEAGVSAIE